MEALALILAAVCAIGVFGFGFFLANGVDKLIFEEPKSNESEEAREPGCIMLTDELSLEEMTDELRRFREHHKKVTVLIYDGECKNEAK